MREKLIDGLGAGLAATLLMTGLALTFPAAGAPLPYYVLRLLHDLADHPSWLALALALHLTYGGLAGALFFGGARRITFGGGLVFALGLWGVAVALYSPLVGLGFVVSERPQLAVWSLPAHLLYGAVLGVLGSRTNLRTEAISPS